MTETFKGNTSGSSQERPHPMLIPRNNGETTPMDIRTNYLGLDGKVVRAEVYAVEGCVGSSKTVPAEIL